MTKPTISRIDVLFVSQNPAHVKIVKGFLGSTHALRLKCIRQRSAVVRWLALQRLGVALVDTSEATISEITSWGLGSSRTIWLAEEIWPKLRATAETFGTTCLTWSDLTAPMLELAIWRTAFFQAADRESRGTEEQYRALFESSVVGMYRTLPDGRLVLANTALAKICGFNSVEEFLAASQRFDPRSFYVEPDRRDLFIQLLTDERKLSNFESMIRRRDGTTCWIEENAWAVHDGDGALQYFEGTVQDITEHKRMEVEHQELLTAEAGRQAAEEASRRSAMLAQVSHILASSLDVTGVLWSLAKLVLEYMADWCVLDMVYGEEIRREVLVQADARRGQEAAWLAGTPPIQLDAHNIVARVIRTGKPHLLKTITDRFLRQTVRSEEHFQILKNAGMVSHIIVPLVARGQVLGAMTLVSTDKKHRYGKSDLLLAEDLAARAALAIDNARLYEQAQAEVTERRRAQEGLKFSEKRFRTMIESSADVILLLGPTGLVLYTSPAVQRVLGYEPDDLYIMKDPFSLVHQLDRGRITTLFATMMAKSGDSVAATCQVRHARGGYRSIEFTAINLVEDPAIGAAVVTFRDVTERQELEWQKDAFLGIASHELKTPITSMKAFNQILERHLRLQGNEEGLSYVLKTQKQLTKLTRMVNNLLDVTRLQSEGFHLSIAPLNLDLLIREAIEEVGQLSTSHEVVVHGEIGYLVEADRDRVSQVLVSLLTNAIKYSPLADRVDVWLGVDEGMAQVTISDYGMGIAEKDFERIFERFYRAEGVLSSVAGLGLGLYVAAQIIQAHGGRITVESRLTEGATFSLTLPFRQSSVDL